MSSANLVIQPCAGRRRQYLMAAGSGAGSHWCLDGMARRILCTLLILRIMMTKMNWTHKNCTKPGLCLEFCGKNECLAEESKVMQVSPEKHQPLTGIVDEEAALIPTEELANMQALFNMRWKADMRAIKRWQAAGTGRERIWPDHADLVVWLLEQLDVAEGKLDAISDLEGQDGMTDAKFVQIVLGVT